MDIMRQSACLVVNPITVDSYGFLFNCTTVGQASVKHLLKQMVEKIFTIVSEGTPPPFSNPALTF